VSTKIVHDRLVTRADSEQETATRRLRDGVGRGSHRDRIARPDIRDSGGDDQALRMRK
jgi:hypothetical protein